MRDELLGSIWGRQGRVVLGNKGVLRMGAWAPFRSLAWMVILVIVTAAIISLQSLVKAWFPSHTLTIAMAFVCTVLSFGAYAVLVRKGERRSPTELSPQSLWQEYAVGFLVGCLLVSMTIGLLWLTGLYEVRLGSWTDWPHDLRETIGTGLLEELLARLIIFRLLARAFGLPAGLIVSALAFGAAHLANPNASLVAAVAIAAEAGLLLGGSYILTGRIWLPAGIHTGWNLMLGGVLGARVSGMPSEGSLFTSIPKQGSMDLVTGGTFGPEGSLPAVIFCLAAFAITIWLLPPARQ